MKEATQEVIIIIKSHLIPPPNLTVLRPISSIVILINLLPDLYSPSPLSTIYRQEPSISS